MSAFFRPLPSLRRNLCPAASLPANISVSEIRRSGQTKVPAERLCGTSRRLCLVKMLAGCRPMPTLCPAPSERHFRGKNLRQGSLT